MNVRKRHILAAAYMTLTVFLPMYPATSHASDGEPAHEMFPVVRYIVVDGDEDKFAEDRWIDKGWAGGLENFLLEKSIRKKWVLRLEGRFLVPEEDYNLQLHLEGRSGFVRTGYSEYRKYYDDTGGFFGSFSVAAFDLKKDLHLDIGNFFVEAGLTLPNLPEIVVGYEHRFKEGEKSLLNWGGVTEQGLTRKIFPAFKDIDEQLDVITVAVDHRIGKVDVTDRFRYETYGTDTRRSEMERNLDAAASEIVRISEDYDHDAIHNTFHVDSRLRDDFYISMGYLYSDVAGNAAFNMVTAPFGPEPFDKNWRTRSVELDQKSHVINANSMLGPFGDVNVYGGVQAEYTESDGETNALLTETLPNVGPVSPEAEIRTRTDKEAYLETLGIRFSGIPYTSVWVEGKWAQQDIDLFEREVEDAALAFVRLTDSDIDRSRYTVGFSSSPVRRLTFFGRYRLRCHENDYNHTTDTEAGYSAFIRKQELTTREFDAKATARVTPWIKTTLHYHSVDTEIDTRSKTTPPSSIESGDYSGNIYNLSATLTPGPGLYVTGFLSYQDICSKSFDNGSGAVVDYEADIYSFFGTAGWAVGKTTTLTLDYRYTLSDNVNTDTGRGLPLGTDNRRHGFTLAWSHRFSEQVRAQIRYGLYTFDDDGNGGIDDYTAHLLGAGLELAF
ncbi:MAG: hypothetical protein R6U50_09080 [Desulfobacterales bacterium]